MNKPCRSIALTILVPVFAFASGGCFYAVAGVGAFAGYRFVDGEYEGVIKADLESSIKATRAAFEDLDIRERSVEESDGRATIKGVSEGSRDVRVSLEPTGDGSTNVRVRVDTFGDQSFSQIVVNSINANL